MRKILTVIALLVCATLTKAQQDAHYTQFMYNNIINNPGFAGSRRVPTLTATYRNQWMGYEGNPKSYLLSFDAPINSGRLATGVVLANQSEGITHRQFGNLVLSYAAVKTEKATFRIGLNMSLRQYQYNLQDPNVYVQERQDASLTPDNPKLTNANVGVGFYFDTEKFYAGISIPNLNKNAIALGANPSTELVGRENRHIYVMAGGLFPLGSENLVFKPSLMYKYVANAPFSLDLNTSVMVQKRFTAGVSYRIGESNKFGDSVDFLGFVQANDKLGIGFSYDYTLSEIKNYSNGTIEAVIRYDFGSSNSLKNPRFFF
jgi:type IX secretion system PorP/SprF family membrane protein